MSAIPRTASVPSEQNKKITGCKFFALHPVCFLLGVRLFLLRLLLCVFVFVVFLLEGEAELELFVAVVHKVLEYDRGGDYQRADDERRYVVEEEIADSKEEHRNDDSERIGLYNDYQAEYGGYDGHSENHEAVRNEREQDAVGGGDSLSAFEFKYGRKRVAEHGRRAIMSAKSICL